MRGFASVVAFSGDLEMRGRCTAGARTIQLAASPERHAPAWHLLRWMRITHGCAIARPGTWVILRASRRSFDVARCVAPATRERGVPTTLCADPGFHTLGTTNARWTTAIYLETSQVQPSLDSRECISAPAQNVVRFGYSGPNTPGARPYSESASLERYPPAWHGGGMAAQGRHADFFPDAPANTHGFGGR